MVANACLEIILLCKFLIILINLRERIHLEKHIRVVETYECKFVCKFGCHGNDCQLHFDSW